MSRNHREQFSHPEGWEAAAMNPMDGGKHYFCSMNSDYLCKTHSQNKRIFPAASPQATKRLQLVTDDLRLLVLRQLYLGEPNPPRHRIEDGFQKWKALGSLPPQKSNYDLAAG